MGPRKSAPVRLVRTVIDWLLWPVFLVATGFLLVATVLSPPHDIKRTALHLRDLAPRPPALAATNARPDDVRAQPASGDAAGAPAVVLADNPVVAVVRYGSSRRCARGLLGGVSCTEITTVRP